MMLSEDLILGIDGGGTSTACLLTDKHGHALAQVEAPASNFRKVGLQETHLALLTGIKAVAREAGIEPFQPMCLAAVCAGLAGVDTPADELTLRQMLSKMVSSDHLQVINDGEIALAGALQDQPGVLVISGTGSIAWAASVSGHRVRVGGWDYLLGDEGSGYEIGSQVLRAVAAAHDGRTAPTILTEGVFKAFNVSDFASFLKAIYGEGTTPTVVAKLAQLADAAASAGDQAAIRILREAAQELALIARAAARLSDLEAGPFPVVALGGVLVGSAYYAQCFRQAMVEISSNAFFVHPKKMPVEGAILLALRSLATSRKDPCPN
ncbi:MAG: BadF/BadG/BcrA/BcrD ATPase family protein [bacterium]